MGRTKGGFTGEVWGILGARGGVIYLS